MPTEIQKWEVLIENHYFDQEVHQAKRLQEGWILVKIQNNHTYVYRRPLPQTPDVN